MSDTRKSPSGRTIDTRARSTLRVPAALHDKIRVSALSAGLGVNKWIVRQLEKAVEGSADAAAD